jgi:hypothetical protein
MSVSHKRQDRTGSRSGLVNRARVRRAAPDRASSQLGAIFRTPSASHTGQLEVAHVRTAPRLQLGHGRADLTMQPAPFSGRERSSRPRRIEAGAPQGFVREEVAETCDSALVHQPGLERSHARIERIGQLSVADRGGVRAKTIFVGIELHAPEAARIVDAQVATIDEVHDEPVSSR